MEVTVYYLEMREPSTRFVQPPCPGLTVKTRHPGVPYYRFLYNSVGEEYNWVSRRKLSDQELATIIHDPLDEVNVLYVCGVPAGFAEFDRRQSNEVEIVQFGLMPSFIGQGLGKWFLQQIIDKAWAHRPRRVWLHTCTLDHPAALPNYQKAGFALVKEEKTAKH